MNSFIEQIQIEEIYSRNAQDWAEYKAWLDKHYTQEENMTLFEKIVQLQIPHSNHYSDLYIPVTTQTTQLLKEHNAPTNIFINQVEGGLWYDVPFAYDPYWAARGVTYK